MPRLATVTIAIFVYCPFLACANTTGVAADAAAQNPASQVWLANTRSAPGCGDLEAGASQITYFRLDEACCRWQAADAAAFQAAFTPGVPTIVLVHGNGSDEEAAVQHGNELYCLLKQHACGHPFRLVVWSWPADKVVRRPRPDVQIKVCRSDVEAYYLAHMLAKLPKGAPLTLVGYSLGARTVCGALELLAGGPAACRNLPAETLEAWKASGPRPIRMMLLAAAMDSDWLEPCCPDGLALVAVERTLVSRNGYDKVLKWYSRLYGRNGPEALGYAGPASTVGGKLEIVDLSCEIGREHDFDRYQESSAVSQRLGWYTFLCDPPTQAAKKAEKSALAANNRPAK
jgi:pimeloyl-ACP methyl ester carboxylesterase